MSKGKSFVILFLSEKSGKHYSVKMNLLTLTMLVIFFVCLITVTTLSIKNYFQVYQQNKKFQNLIGKLESDLVELQEESKEAFLFKQWADKLIYRRMYFEDIKGEGDLSVSENTLVGEIPGNSSQQSYLLDVDEFDVRRLNLDLDFEVSCKLINCSRKGKKLSGYFYFIASNKEVIPEIYAVWPQVEMLSGKPKDYTKGMNFSIRYLKDLKGRIDQPDMGAKFNRVDLIAYSEDGNILMKKGYYIERLLQQIPYE